MASKTVTRSIRKIITSLNKGVMVQTEPLKFRTVLLPEKKSRAFFFFISCQLAKFITRKVCCVVLPLKCWHGGSVARVKASFSCICPIYLKLRISPNIFFQFCLSWKKTSFFGQNVSCKKRWVDETASSTRIINGSCKHGIREKNQLR